MKNLLLSIGLLILLTGCSDNPAENTSPAKESAPQAQPKEKPEPEQDLSATEISTANTIQAGKLELSPADQYKKAQVGTSEVEFIYTAFNSGSSPIRITRVDSGCACIEESVEPEVIPPGESGVIRAVYSTERLNGLAEKTLGISTDQRGVKEAFLGVKLEMEPIYIIEPELTTWKKGDKPAPKSVVFEVTREKPIRLLSARSSRSEIKTRIEEVEPGRKYKIHITPENTGANLLGMIRLETNCEIEAHARPLLYVTVQ